MVTLRPMTEAEYEPFIDSVQEEYAQERAKSGKTPIEEERKISNKKTAELVPQGSATPNHYFWTVTDEIGAGVGSLWVFVDPEKERAYIYSIALGEAQRGKGYGRQTLDALEAAMRPLGVKRIALTVFAKNTVARHLYDTQGYYIVDMSMQKDI